MDFKNNKLFIELDRQSKIDYSIYLELFNYNKINNNESDIRTFIDFLFSDIIKIDPSKIDELENIAKDITLSQNYFNN